MPRTPTGRRSSAPKPVEQKRLLGNPGKRPLPRTGTLVALPGASDPPEPARPLGAAGRALWERLWRSPASRWLARDVDAEAVLMLCEQADERVALRVTVLRDGDWRARAALRALDAQVAAGLGALGLNPVDRARLALAEVRPANRLDELVARRSRPGQ
jgi:hypothetical protein